jgi:small subunit ribosomal protein S5
MINSQNSSEKGKNTNRVRRNKKPQEKSVRWEQRLVQIQRVSKVVKGGKKLSFRATVIVGNQNSQVGVGVGKADEVSTAVKKAVNNARKNLIRIPLTKAKTIPHNVIGVDGACKVLIRPAGPGTGVIAGSSIRIVLELAGIQNILAKQLGGNNLLNNARATIVALKSLKTAQQVAEERDIPLERIFSYNKQN